MCLIAGTCKRPAAILCALTGSILFAFSGEARSATWCVPALLDGCDFAQPTVQGAINAASAGDTVKVSAGTYAEGAIWITKQLTLLGAQAGVDARSRSGAAETESILMPSIGPNMPVLVLTDQIAGTVIDGFTFSGGNLSLQNQAPPPPLLRNDGLIVRNNRFGGFWGGAINFEAPGSDITIDRNVFDGSSRTVLGAIVSCGAYNGDYRGFWFTNNALANGPAGTNTIGLVCGGSGNVGPSPSRAPLIKGNTFSGLFAGVVLLENPFVSGEISDNTFVGNNHGINAGLRGTLVLRNTFQDNTSFGLMPAAGSHDNTIRENRFVGNGADGTGFGLNGTFVASEVADNLIVGNGTGLMGQVTSTTVAGNVFRENIVDGANLYAGAVDSTFTENEFVSNGRNGLLGTLASTLVERNVFLDNEFSGLSFSAKADTPNGDNEVVYNQFFDNGGAGISSTSPNSQIVGNMFVGNGRFVPVPPEPQRSNGAIHGIGESMFVERNLLVDNHRFALFVAPKASSTVIEDNLIRSNGETACGITTDDPTACGGGVMFGARSTGNAPEIYQNAIVGNRVGAVLVPPTPLPDPYEPPVKDMTYNYWGAPGGPVGDDVIAVDPGVILYQPWLSAMPEVPHMLTMSALADVITMPPASDEPTAARVERIRDAIWTSLDPDFWATEVADVGFTLTDQGNKVFDSHKRAVIELRKLIADGGVQSGAAKESLDYLLGADKLLARSAIDEAIAESGSAAQIARAESEYSKGIRAVEKDNWDSAVDYFKKAWLHAMLAL